MDYEDLAAQWLNEQRLRQVKPKAFKKAFIGARGYEHFDTPINLQDSATIGSLVSRMSSVDAILKWQFLPFVTKYKRTRKYRHSSINRSSGHKSKTPNTP